MFYFQNQIKKKQVTLTIFSFVSFLAANDEGAIVILKAALAGCNDSGQLLHFKKKEL